MKQKKLRGGSARGQSIPPSLQGQLDSFAGCFSGTGFENFVALVSGWIGCQGRHCVSRVIQVAGGPASSKHFSTLYRFLSSARWSLDAVGRVLFETLIRLLSKDIEALIDDTLCRHGGPRIFGAAMHRDGTVSTYGRGTSSGRSTFFACGHCWVVLAIRVPLPWDQVRGIAIPILFRLYRSKKYCDDRSYRKRTELAAELVALLESWVPDQFRLYVIGDSEYACKTVVRGRAPETTFIGPMVKDAALYAPVCGYQGRGRPRKVGRRLRSPERLAAAGKLLWKKVTVQAYGRKLKLLVKERTCLWYTVAGTRLVRVIITRDPKGRSQDRAYFCTDPEIAVAEILERFARRWLIEVSFRDIKQHLGLEDPQNGWSRSKRRSREKKKPGPQPRGKRGSVAVLHTVPLAFVAYAVTVLWFLNEGDAEREVQRVVKASPWYRRKKVPSFGDMLVALRREIWVARLSENPADERMCAKTRELLPDALLVA